MIAAEQAALIEILTFVAGALLFIGIGSFVSTLYRPHRPNVEKLSTYESGETPVASSWGQFNSRFYIIAMVFVLFEIETVLLFPWATIWNHPELNELTGGFWAYYTALSALIFITLLAIGLAYVWSKGHFGHLQPAPLPPSFVSQVPSVHYERNNRRYASSITK
jgi:NADH-quinone oxidoreductase subunit A